MSNSRQLDNGTIMRTFGLTYTQPVLTPPPSQAWHQFVVAIRGPLAVTAAQATWLVPPGTGLWIPAGLGCTFRNRSETSLRMLYLPASHQPPFSFEPQRCAVLSVSPFLRELVHKIVMIGALVEHEPRHRRLAETVWDELSEAKEVPLTLIEPRSPEARRAMESLESSGFRLGALGEAAEASGVSRRTLERIFSRETELSLGDWAMKRRLMAGLERLLAGEPVAQVAFELGYSGPSAFTAMFRKEMGVPPVAYIESAWKARSE